MTNDDYQKRNQLTNEITKKTEELKALKKELKTNYKLTYRNAHLTMVPLFRETHTKAKDLLNKYMEMTGLKKMSWDDFINVLLKLCDDYMTNLTNEKENENPIK